MELQKETKVSAKAVERHGKWYDDACGMAFALELVGERWSLLIVRELMFGGRRFSDLRAGMPGISAKVLTERLESMERAKIVQRRRLTTPATVQLYELTPWGYEAEEAMLALCRWAVRSPNHDPTLWLSAASLMLSMRVMFQSALAADKRLQGAIRVGSDVFVVEVAEGRFHVARGEAEAPAFVFATPAATPVIFAAYGKVPLEQLEGAGLIVSGDRAAAQQFLDCFQLPEKFA